MTNGVKGVKIVNNELVVTAEYIKAKNLDRKIKTSAQLAQQSLYDMCMSFKEMRDSKLYKELGYSDFGSYCEQETGFKRAQVYNYISIVEKLPQNFVQSIGQIGMTKLTLLTTIPDSQRKEIVQNIDIESTSVRELKEKISELEKNKTSAKERQDKLLKKNLQLVEEIDSCKKEKSKVEEAVQRLENQIKELENQPRDCYEDTTKIDELTAKFNEERERYKTEIESLKNSETNIAPVSDVEKDIEGQFRAYMSGVVDSMKRLTSFVEKNRDSPQHFLFLKKLESIVLLTNQTINKLKGE